MSLRGARGFPSVAHGGHLLHARRYVDVVPEATSHPRQVHPVRFLQKQRQCSHRHAGAPAQPHGGLYQVLLGLLDKFIEAVEQLTGQKEQK